MFSETIYIFSVVFAVLIGLCFGSMANVLIYRVPRGESFVLPPSHCTRCQHRLGALELIPVLSFVVLRGRCRHCREKFSARYVFVEIACAVLFGLASWFGSGFDAIFHAFLAFVLLTISVIDWDTQEIPDGLVIAGAVAGVLFVAAGALFVGVGALGAPSWQDAALGVLAGGLPLFLLDRLTLLIAKKDGFGYGDVKLMAMAGLFLGWQLVLAAYFFAFISGGLFAFFLILSRRASRGSYMPFGPFLSAGVLGALWFGHRAIDLILW